MHAPSKILAIQPTSTPQAKTLITLIHIIIPAQLSSAPLKMIVMQPLP